MVQNKSPPSLAGLNICCEIWICDGCVLHTCVQVAISESFLTTVMDRFSPDNSAFYTIDSETRCRPTTCHI